MDNNLDTRPMIHSMIMDLSSASKKNRKAALEKLSLDQAIDVDIPRILSKIEDVPATITEYREKERYLEELLQFIRSRESPASEETCTIILSHLIGSLYINFEKFWGPTLRVINVMINESKHQCSLLDFLILHLQRVNEIIYKIREDEASKDDRADHVLHRNFIFQILTRFASYIESRSVLFMNQLFLFIHHEMLTSPFVEKFTRESLYKCKGIEEENPLDDREENNCKDDEANQQLKKRKSKETFLTAVKIIHSFKSMKKVHRRDDFKSILMDLLCCRDNSIQKASFNCLLVYEIEEIKPYIPKILRILDDKSARTELSSFSLDIEDDQITSEHRAQVIPILLRILYGKMKGQIGKKSSGKSKADQRKTLVMRFVAGCSVDEVLEFLKLLFEPIFPFVPTPYDSLASHMSKELDFSNYVPLNRLHAMMVTLSAYIKSIAHLKDDSLEHIFKLICILIYHVILPMSDQACQVQTNFKTIESLKTLRRGCFGVLNEFFQTFEYYRFQEQEINFIFRHLIWPSTVGFIDRNHSNPTPLIKFIQTLSENRTYHNLLIKRNEIDQTEYLLKHVIELYTSDKTGRSMLKFVSSILASIVDPDTYKDDESDSQTMMDTDKTDILQDKDAKVPQYDQAEYKISQNMPINHEMLLSSLPEILERLKRCCEIFIEKKNENYRLDRDELKILSTLSVYVKNGQQGLLMARLLLTALDGLRKESLIMDSIGTARLLIEQSTDHYDPEIVYLVANFLGYQRNNDQRQSLCELLKSISTSKGCDLSNVVSAIELMNSTFGDQDSPDLVKCNEGFRSIFSFLDSLDFEKMNCQNEVGPSISLLIHQVGYIMSNIDKYEFSVRENCALFYEKLSTRLALIDHESRRDFINKLILELLLNRYIKKGLRETNEAIKHSFIGALRSLIIHCHVKCQVLGELHYFYHVNQDLDFWLNIKHIQLHHRSKALARLIASDKLDKLSPKTMSAYLMPIAAGFLFSKSYKSLASLVENSIKLVGIVCRKLNWPTYESTLNYYLGLLTKANAKYQRQNIKLISTIIKNFNFDLTSCKEAMQYEEENLRLEKRMQKRRGILFKETGANAIDAAIPKGKKLNQSTAKMVYLAVTKKIIPKLDSCFNEMTRVELEHDKNMSNYLPEKNEIKRIPIAFAIVQLLNLLPGRYVLYRDHLPSLFLKLSSFLKSKSESIRKAARDTLIRIMNFVGPAYMPDLLRVLKENLDKGFQIHVLTYTIHSILDQSKLTYGDLDHSVNDLVELSMKEIFGAASEDKEIAQILAKTPEAKKTKGYDTLRILSSSISDEKLSDLMSSIKESLKTSNDSKKVNKLSVCIEKIFTGLMSNENFPLDKLLEFIRVQIEQCSSSIRVHQKFESKDTNGSTNLREDRYLIKKDTPRHKLVSKINEKGNIHMIVDNSLRLLLHILTEHKSTIMRGESHKSKLDSFINLLSFCLKSTSPKCVMRSLKCIYFITKVKPDSPSFEAKCNSLVKKIFVILNRYNGIGMVQGDNLEMIRMCFETLSELLLKCEHVKLNDTQVRALLSYIEQDLHDSSRQKTAFKALHSVLKKTIEAPEIDDIMSKVAELLITSNDETIQSITTKIWHVYLLDYKHEAKALQGHLMKFLRQLDYEHIDGRLSVLRMIDTVVTKFPESILREHLDLIFHLLAQRLVNEDTQDVRSKVGKVIGKLIQRVQKQQNYLFNRFIMPWASGDNKSLKLLGVKLLSVIIEVGLVTLVSDKDRLRRILQAISNSLTNSQGKLCAPIKTENEEDTTNSADVEDVEATEVVEIRLPTVDDKLNYSALRLFGRMVDRDLIGITDSRLIEDLKPIWQIIFSDLLTNWHPPVVTISSELTSLFINKSDLLEALNPSTETNDPYLKRNSKKIIRLLVDKFITLLDRVEELESILDTITGSMILLGLAVARSKATINFESSYKKLFKDENVIHELLEMENIPKDGFDHDKLPYSITEAKRKLDLMWFSLKVVMQARKEVALFRLKRNFRRNFVLKWTAAVAQELGSDRIQPYVFLYTMTPVRELTDKGKNKDIDMNQPSTIGLSEDLLKFIKTLIGVETFNKVYSKVQIFYTRKRVIRKRNEAITRVKDQARGVKRKLKLRQDKRKSRKR